jgi:putative ABC transport system permease protein
MIRDLLFGLRGLFRTPAFTLTALIVLALGIGANSAIFSVVSPVLFKPLPFPEPEKVVSIVPSHKSTGREWNFSKLTFEDFVQRQHTYEALAAFTRASVAMSTATEPVRVTALYASPTLFAVMKREAFKGRGLVASDDDAGAAPVAVLSYAGWTKHFASDPSVVGRPVLIDGQSFVIVGITPEDLRLPSVLPVLYVPLRYHPDTIKFGNSRGHHNLQAVGRIASGATLEAARADSVAVFGEIEQVHTDEALRPKVMDLKERTTGDSRPAAIALLLAVALVLLIACANVAGLLLVRSSSRQREISIRLALGATRARVVRQMLTESVLLGLSGAALGLLVALWTVDGLKALAGSKLAAVELDAPVLAFTAAIGVATGLLFGLVPALHASRVGLHEALKDAGTRASASRGRRRAQAALIGVQIAFAFALLAGAGLMFQSLYALSRVDPGFKFEHLLTVRLNLPDATYSTERKRALYKAALEQAAALPGVVAVASVDPLPFSDGNSFNGIYPIGHPPGPGEETSANMYEVSEGYFDTMGIPLKEGRSFLPEEQQPDDGRTVIVSEKLAKQFWPGESALGKEVIGIGPKPHTVVGVVGDVRHGTLDSDPRAAFYVPWQQSAWLTQRLVVRTSSAPSALLQPLRKLTRSLDPNLPTPEPDLVSELVEDASANRRVTMIMLTAFAAMALLLSAIGLWGLIAYAVGQRRQELAIRLALGAPHGHVVGLVLKQGVWLTAFGLLGGVAMAVLGSRVLEALLFGIKPVDALTYAAIALVLGAVALLACFVPARAATRVDPNAALRA